MARNKKKTAANIKVNQAAANEYRQQFQRLPPEPVSAPASRAASPAPLPPVLPLKEYRRRHITSLPDTIRASLIPLPDSNDDDIVTMSPKEGMNMMRRRWEKMGFYSTHPNNNPQNASEDEIEKMLRVHPKLGPSLKEYKLFLNPPKKMRSLLLSFPSRDGNEEYRESSGTKPLELRIKPKHGLVELDVPVNVHSHYDREKGVTYGRALRNSHLRQQGGSTALSGGLGLEFDPPTAEDRRTYLPEGPTTEKLLENFDDADNKGYVMNKITLGGIIVPFKDGDPIYMSAAFNGDECTWTRIDAMVELRPQLNHLDAVTEPDRTAKRILRAREAAEAKRLEEKEAQEAKAVNQTVKSTESKDSDEDDFYGGMKKTNELLTAMRDEKWQRLEWIDQDDEESFQVYDENLVYQDSKNAPRLVSELTDEQWLDAISCPRIDPAKQARKAQRLMASSGASDVGSTEESSDEKEKKDRKKKKKQLPYGVVRPADRDLRVEIEILCRAICSKPPKQHGPVEAHLKKKFQGTHDHRFMNPSNEHYRFYKWRLAENKAGRGHSPEHDFPELQRQLKKKR